MRLQNKIIQEIKASFNPRICKRCDGLTTYETKAINVSIHASVKDATWSVKSLRVVYVFQSTHL